jgi:hypothetical protein
MVLLILAEPDPRLNPEGERYAICRLGSSIFHEAAGGVSAPRRTGV